MVFIIFSRFLLLLALFAQAANRTSYPKEYFAKINAPQYAASPFFSKVQILTDSRLPVGPPSQTDLHVLQNVILPEVSTIYTENKIPTWFEFLPPRSLEDLTLPPQLKIEETNTEALTEIGRLTSFVHAHTAASNIAPIVIANVNLLGINGLAIDMKFIEKIIHETGMVLPKRQFILIGNDPNNDCFFYKTPSRICSDVFDHSSAHTIAHELNHLAGLDHVYDKNNLMRPLSSSLDRVLNARQRAWLHGWLQYHGYPIPTSTSPI